LLARTGVAVGEGGSGPAAHSMLADYFPHGQRSTALAIYSCGVPIGILFGLAVGGWVSQTFGWRMAFLVVGMPGLMLAVLMFLTVKEPVREILPPKLRLSCVPFGRTVPLDVYRWQPACTFSPPMACCSGTQPS
jgi:predicted MFS family arabinose efflux permease